jgi:hypothetical protein
MLRMESMKSAGSQKNYPMTQALYGIYLAAGYPTLPLLCSEAIWPCGQSLQRWYWAGKRENAKRI